ncbi:MAG TPA: hypothetical protein PK490_13805 [Prosthecobacter sp.]|nr:hypothetical protein [Prosthecobacter sp.]HRK15350.1 hypothetical protein [Prosthecobacter sp.]
MKTFGLISQLAQTRVTLPLIHIETRFRVTGEFAAVEMDQVFEQTAREPLDVTPLRVQRPKASCTVERGGYSLGSMRHWQPVFSR